MGMDNHLAPQLPTPKMMESIQRLTINIVTGVVDGPKKKDVGNKDAHGHIIVNIWDGSKQKKVRRCHLVWWKATGEWPTTLIDHENRIKDDDSFGNLRTRTHRQNMTNKIGSGELLVGVKPSGDPELPFKCSIKSVYVGLELGLFKTEEEANNRYTEASELISCAIREVAEKLNGRG